MTTEDMVVLTIQLAAVIPAAYFAWRYAVGRTRLAERLRDQGWVCVGCNFLTGPVMIPPTPADM